MEKAALGYSYIYENGAEDPAYKMLKFCGEKVSYLVLKNTSPGINFMKAYIGSLSYHVAEFANGDFRIFADTAASVDDIIRFHTVIHNEEENKIARMEQLLDENTLVGVITVGQYLEFYNNYSTDFDAQKYKVTGHPFLVVAHDQEHYYYVEDKNLVNPKTFVPYLNRNDIGVIRKKDTELAFQTHLSCLTISIKPENLCSADRQILSVMDHSLRHYRTDSVQQDEKGCYYNGRLALQRLLEHCDTGDILLNERRDRYNINHTVMSLIEWQFDVFSSKRELLCYYFKEHLDNPLCARIVDQLLLSGKKWILFRNVLSKNYIGGKYRFDGKYKKYLLELMDIDDELFGLLDKYMKQLE